MELAKDNLPSDSWNAPRIIEAKKTRAISLDRLERRKTWLAAIKHPSRTEEES